MNPPARGSLIVDVVSDDKATPVASPVYATGLVDEPITINPLTVVISPSTEPLRLVKVDPPKQVGGVKVTPDLDAGQVTVVGAQAGSYYLDYQVAAGAGCRRRPDPGRRDELRRPRRPPPVAMTDTAFLPIGGEVLVDLTANDIDPSGRALAVQQLTVARTPGLVVTVSDMHLVRISARRARAAGRCLVLLRGVVRRNVGHRLGPGGLGADAAGPGGTDRVADPGVGAGRRRGDRSRCPATRSTPAATCSRCEPFDADTVAAGQGLLFTSADAIRYLAPANGGPEPIKHHLHRRQPGREDRFGALQITVVADRDEEPCAAQRRQLTVARTFVGSSVDIPLPVDGIDPDGDWAVLSASRRRAAAGRASVVGASTLRYTAFDVAGPDTVELHRQRSVRRHGDRHGEDRGGRPAEERRTAGRAGHRRVRCSPTDRWPSIVLSQVSDPAGYEVKFAAKPLTTKATHPAVSYKVTDGVVVLKAGKDDTVEPITYTVVNERGLSADRGADRHGVPVRTGDPADRRRPVRHRRPWSPPTGRPPRSTSPTPSAIPAACRPT